MATPTSNGVVSNVSLYGSNYIDSLLDGKKWGGSTGTGANLTYSFGSFSSYYKTGYGSGEPESSFAPLTDIQKSATKMALGAWSEIANINFTEVTDSASVAGDLRFANSNQPGTAWAYTPNASPEAGDVWFSHNSTYNTNQKGTYGYATFLHEIGHALGLTHPHESDFGGAADSSIDTTAYSVMSYKSYVGAPLTGYTQSFYPTTPMLNDIAAIQYLYGANMTTRSGNTTYSWAPGQQLLETIWDAGGTDTIDWSNQTSSAKINLNAGQWSELGPSYWNGIAWETKTLAIAYNVTIENATGGAGNDTITGNAVNNVLSGGAGNDIFYGNAGNDSLYGGDGSDWIYGATGNDYADGGNGNDNIWGDAGNDSLSGNAGNDNLYGGDGNDYLYGQADNDYVTGGNGNDAVNGGLGNDTLLGSYGDDTLTGGAGNDTLYGGAGADKFVFNYLSEKIDIVQDFQRTEGDKIQVSKWGFGASSNNQFSYNALTGALFFDASVNDLIAPTQFATLENKPAGFSVNLDIVLV